MTDVEAISEPGFAWRCRVGKGRRSFSARPGRLTVMECDAGRCIRTDYFRGGGADEVTRRVIELEYEGTPEMFVPWGEAGACVLVGGSVLAVDKGGVRRGELGSVQDITLVEGPDFSVVVNARRMWPWYNHWRLGADGQLRSKGWGWAPISSVFAFDDVAVEIAQAVDEDSPWWRVLVEHRNGARLVRRGALAEMGALWFDGWLVVSAGHLWGIPVLFPGGVSLGPLFYVTRAMREMRRRVEGEVGSSIAGWYLVPFSRMSARRLDPVNHVYQVSFLDSGRVEHWDFGDRVPSGEVLVLDPLGAEL